MVRAFGISEFLYLLEGLKWTIALTAVAFAGGGVFGVLIALCRTAPQVWLRWVSGLYVELFRGTPLLMQLFVVHYGLALMGITLNPWLSAAIAFSLHSSAFLGEIWRGSIEAVPAGQTEGATALGLSYWQRMYDVVALQAARIALPSTVGFLVTLIKATSLTSIIGFVELARAGTIVSNQTFNPLLVYGLVGIFYFIICWPLSLLGSHLEHKLEAGQ
jgi:polar amino acid transport system permease protein